MEKIKAPIDEKNVCSDFLEELADGYTTVETCVNGLYCCAFYKFDCLWEARWRSSSNLMSIWNMHNEKMKNSTLIEEIKGMFSESDLVLETFNNGPNIVVRFWWNVEES